MTKSAIVIRILQVVVIAIFAGSHIGVGVDDGMRLIIFSRGLRNIAGRRSQNAHCWVAADYHKVVRVHSSDHAGSSYGTEIPILKLSDRPMSAYI